MLSKNFLKAFRAFSEFNRSWTTLNPSKSPVTADKRLYVVVRNDLLPGLQISQSIHAKDDFTHEHPDEELKWRNESNTIIVLSGSIDQLYSVISKALTNHVKYSRFKEPDLNNQVTAVALEPGEKTVEIVKGLPLALRDLIL